MITSEAKLVCHSRFWAELCLHWYCRHNSSPILKTFIPDAELPGVPKLKLPEAESEEIYEEYDGEYEKYGNEYAEYVSEGKRKVLKDVNVDLNGAGEKNGDGDKNGQEEEIYEQYDGDYEKYISKNGKSSNRTNPQRRVHRTANKRVR